MATPSSAFITAFRQFQLPAAMLPVFYSEAYNMGFGGIEKVLSPHPFDATKYRGVFKHLRAGPLASAFAPARIMAPPAVASDQDLLIAHSEEYLRSLKSSTTVAHIAEVITLAVLPIFMVNYGIVTPQRTMTSGTAFAAKAAMQAGWAINVGGGFHHASCNEGGGFCIFADISFAIKLLMREGLQRAMIVDLDAHQGNGHENDFAQDKDRVYILDVYNRDIYPGDRKAKSGMSLNVPVSSGIADAEYLQTVNESLDQALAQFSPDLIVYNAGTAFTAQRHVFQQAGNFLSFLTSPVHSF
ncbi:histone deacetylase 11, variant [Capsaspora owczarzaki ATCC 30864]|uniref:Histone deacetylase 11, variant n=1 Tax=Capsaspora owczarzaki (strain ATCC 30864) TaxID=595528 RepID=A0A0D2UKS0_CAPO3|nr:histone deacetylase 11, variant [Capsaspora owczarzaki ATCC 30864]